ncbi:hypothetical protein BST92_05940 [Nonlabens arenilitoris]|uniref:Glutamyl-tRNA synthetase n=1 Tax=Nonlabens arenilitoris TaxID=1217969 RepID=A0A2S7UB44_9FLAO|nr:collagen-like protein [Nonlabens arenilitoris]PQJ31493.1 hypothetical protein BST92_05940 [Nonlabens arenilitoris]
MNNFQIIEHKLKLFIKKYYTNEIIRGIILFLAIGLLYFLFTAVIEHFLWLSSTGRTILFGLFVLVQATLLFKFIGIPLARLFKLFSGIDFRDASNMIGTHFPEVSDKLINVLQLHKNGGDDELTWASINQKSEELKPIPFSLAIDFKKNTAYLKYLAIPVLIIAVLFFTGNNDVITESTKRVANFNNEYIPPAPFTFTLLNDDLNTLQKRDFKLNVDVSGRTIPENASIHFNDQTYYLTQEAPGRFSFIFNNPSVNTPFYLKANEVRSEEFELKVDAVPSINKFELFIDYPSYTGKKDEIIKSTGNALVPQGTKITWRLQTVATDRVEFKSSNAVESFQKDDNEFAFAKAILKPLKYAISTSNINARDYEELNFKIDVTKDDYPELTMEMKKDSIQEDILHFRGQVADDYGIKKIQLVYYESDSNTNRQIYEIGKNRGTFDQFLFTFPDNLPLTGGKNYQFYFEVIDNDAVNNFKSSKSQVYGFKKSTKKEEEQLQLQDQKKSLEELEKSLKEQDKQQEELKEISQEQIEKKQRGFNDKKKLEQALKNQQEQEREMRQQMEKMRDNLEKSNPQKDPMKEALKERLQQSEEEIKKNEELLKELQEYQDKLSKEDLKEKLEKAQKNSKQQKRNLKQLLELTKMYYVTQKYEQMINKLKDLSTKQEEQSKKKGDDNKKVDQDSLNQEYKDWEKELQELEKENNGLKKPMKLDFDPLNSPEIKEEQQQSSEYLENSKTPEASKKQKSAADKMRQQAQAMQAQMSSGKSEKMKEDADMLRQILDNLIVFSKEQENVLNGVKSLNRNSPNFGKKLKIQKDLERAFKHVDDSLFALASRNPEVGIDINREVTDIYYYIDKSLTQLSDFEMDKGQISQQFTLNGANKLANMLSSVMDAMNNAMALPGKGEGEPGEGQSSGFQLPDIIKKQESLMKEGDQGEEGANGEKPGKGDGKKPGDGQPGDSGPPGQGGKNGQEGQSGEGGESGQGGQSGQGGKDGTGSTGESGQGGSNDQGGQGSNGEGSGSDGVNGIEGSGNASGAEEEKSGYRESEEESARIYEIYKRQQELRNQLENMIRQEGLEGIVDDITDKMKSVERKLLDQGFNRDVQNQMMEIQHDLLKLKDAGLEQGKEDQREANTNRKVYNNPTNSTLPDASMYFNSKEILNRQVLPLQQQYKKKVKEYFKEDGRL